MKKLSAMMLAGMLALSLAACGTNEAQENTGPESISASQALSDAESASSAPEETPADSGASAEVSAEQDAGAHMLVAYFSYAENAELPQGVDASASASIQIKNDQLTGNTGVVAGMIAETVGADLFSIQTVEKYPASYNETIDRGQEERSADARPALVSLPEHPDQYDVIFLGFPNWWGDMPMAMYSFLDETDLSGKTIVPFVTSGGSGFSDTIRTIESLEPDATVREGLAVRDSSATDALEQVREWLAGLGYAE